MASMISYFGTIYSRSSENGEENQDSPSSQFSWNGETDITSNLKQIKCPVTQLRILLEQSLAAAYYLKFYGARCHEMITEYIEELNADISYRFSRLSSREFNGNFAKIYSMLSNLVKFNRGGNWTDVDIGLVDEFLFFGPVDRTGCPEVWTEHSRHSLLTFLVWMNKGIDPKYSEISAQDCKILTFTISNSLYLDSKYYSVQSVFHSIGRSFSYEKTPLDKLDTCPIVGYLSHFNLSSISFASLVGVMSEFCIHSDIERYGISMTHHLAYCLRQGVVFPTYDISGAHFGLNEIASKYRDRLFTVMLTFLDFCSKYRGMAVTERKIVAKAFGCIAFTKEQKDSVNYLCKCDATASSDELKSFQKTMGSIESLQLISQNQSLISAQSSQVTGTADEAGTQKGEGENKTESDKDKGKEGTADAKDAPEKKDAGSDDKEKATDDDDGAADTNVDDTPDNTDTQPEQTDAGAGAGNGPSGSSTTNPSVQTGGTPESTTTSDEKGIVFKITPQDGDTVDTVLFREEVDKLITNVLTNPPKCMSPQDIDTLNELQKYWLHYLSIETIKGIVEACVKLPNSLKQSIHKSTEK